MIIPRRLEVPTAILRLACVVTALAGCGGDEELAPEITAPPTPRSCGVGESELSDGRCQPAGLPLDMACPPAEILQADGSCRPAGIPPEACAMGFVPENGACRAVLPEDDCPPGSMAVPGETACRELAPCGDGRYGSIETEADTEFVDGSYRGNDSDGSRARPWTTIREGVSAAAFGALVAVAAGRYAEDLAIVRKPVRLVGRCPALVEVAGRGTQPSTIGVLLEGASATTIRGLSITDATGGGIGVVGAASVTIEDVWIHDALSTAIEVQKASGTVVRNTLIERVDRGIVVAGVDALVEGTVVRDTLRDPARQSGYGISVQPDVSTNARGKLTFRGSLIERAAELGLFVLGSEASVEGSVVRRTREAGSGGIGIAVEQDSRTNNRSTLTLSASALEENHTLAISVVGGDAIVEASVVRDTLPGASTSGGRGINVLSFDVNERSSLVLRDSVIERNVEDGVFGASADLTISSSIIRGTRPNLESSTARGVTVQQDAELQKRGALTLDTSLIEDNVGGGVVILGSDATITSTVVRDTRFDADQVHAYGITAQGAAEGEGAWLRVQGCVVERNDSLGVFSSGSTTIIESSIVRDTGQDNGAGKGRGVNAQADYVSFARGELYLTGTLVERSAELGVFVGSTDVTIDASMVRGTRSSSGGAAWRDGIAVIDSTGPSVATIRRTAFVDNDRAGLLFVGSEGLLADVISSKNRFGLVLQGVEQPTIEDSNSFRDNAERDRITDGALPVPNTALPIP